jgi:hypothetical protein
LDVGGVDWVRSAEDSFIDLAWTKVTTCTTQQLLPQVLHRTPGQFIPPSHEKSVDASFERRLPYILPPSIFIPQICPSFEQEVFVFRLYSRRLRNVELYRDVALYIFSYLKHWGRS